MTSGPAWLDGLAQNPIVQILALIAAYVIRIEVDRRLRRRETKAAKKKKEATPG